jgi:3-methyladenine DNA glycosylase AlkD
VGTKKSAEAPCRRVEVMATAVAKARAKASVAAGRKKANSGTATTAKRSGKTPSARSATAKRKPGAKRAVLAPKQSAALSAFNSATAVVGALSAQASSAVAAVSMRFFKTAPGQYGAGDKFLGIKVPVLRRMSRQVAAAGLPVVQSLLKSAWHEARLLALFALVQLFERGDEAMRARIFKLYLANTRFINNWDMVDSSAPHIVGAYLLDKPALRRDVLDPLAASEVLWERRIAMLATQHFIRNGDVSETLRLAASMLRDDEDLIHKATGWMLREALQYTDKASSAAVLGFLRQHQRDMPRTMLRYAIERMSAIQRKRFLAGMG